MKQRTRKAYVQLVGAMLIFGSIGILRRAIPLPSGTLACARGLIGGLVMLLYVKYVKRAGFNALQRREMILLILSGALMGLNWMLLFEAYELTTVSKATLSYYMAPTIILFASPLFLHERLTLRNILLALLSAVGMLLVSGVLEESGNGRTDHTGILLGLGAAVIYAAVVLLNKKFTSENVCGKTVVQLLSAGAVLIPYVFLNEAPSAVCLSAREVLLTLVVCTVHTGVAYLLYFGSIEKLPAQSVAVLSYIDPASALIFSFLLLRERMTPAGVIGSVLILGSALLGSRFDSMDPGA